MAGLYAHIPFCSHRCGYCDFATWEGRGHLRERYLAAISRELRSAEGGWPGFETLFVGGGTPTQLDEEQWPRFISALNECAPPDRVIEGAMEANPESLREYHLAALPGWQRRRVSLGVQDFSAAGRAFLERQHDVRDIDRAVSLVRAVGDIELNLDLIVGWNGQTEAGLDASLALALEHEPEHLSVYLLTVEPGTKLGSQVAAGLVPEPDTDMQADAFMQTRERLLAAGYCQYEISNFARTMERACAHNLNYWHGGDYLGVGVSAASHRQGRRWANVRALEVYLQRVEAGESPLGEEEILDPASRELEQAWLGLRLSDGIDLADFPIQEALLRRLLGPFIAQGHLEERRGRWRLSDTGMLLSNEIFSEILAGCE